MVKVKLCFGCKHLVEEQESGKTLKVLYRCARFPNHGPVGIICIKTGEIEEPEPVSRRCFQAKGKGRVAR